MAWWEKGFKEDPCVPRTMFLCSLRTIVLGSIGGLDRNKNDKSLPKINKYSETVTSDRSSA